MTTKKERKFEKINKNFGIVKDRLYVYVKKMYMYMSYVVLVGRTWYGYKCVYMYVCTSILL